MVSFSILFIFLKAPVQAQDVFSAEAEVTDCNGASAQEHELTMARLAELKKVSIDIENQYQKDLLRCPQPPGGAACRKAAWNKRDASRVELDIKKSDENARHDKAMVDVDLKFCHPARSSRRAAAVPAEKTDDYTNQDGSPLLKGGVSKTAGEPSFDGGVPESGYGDGAQTASPQEKESESPPAGTVSPPLALLRDALNMLAPHYDITRPNEGLKVVKDVLVGMALGRILNGVPGAAKKFFGKAGEEVAEEVGSAGERLGLPKNGGEPPLAGEPAAGGASQNPLRGGLSDTTGELPGTGGNPITPTWGNTSPSLPAQLNSWSNPPPGVPVPSFLKTTPRPIFLQEMPSSCVEACVKMVAETVKRRSLPENFLRQIARGNGFNPKYSQLTGTIPTEIPNLLNIVGVKNTGFVVATVDDVAAKTANGYPAIVGISSQVQGHAIIVDAVVGAPGNRFFFIRDPLNLRFFDAGTQSFLRSAGFSNHGVMSEQEFLTQFLKRAVFSNP